MNRVKVLFAASEAVPFVKTGGLADVVGALPFALNPQEFDVRVMLPCYTCLPPDYRAQMKDERYFYTYFNGRDRYVGIRSLVREGVTFYFLDNEEYFGGFGPYTDYTYDIEKFSFFCFSLLASLPGLDFKPDIIHCHDWHTGLIPAYLKNTYGGDPFYQSIRTIFTIHNLKFQGLCGREYLCRISGLPWTLFYEGSLCSGSGGNMMKGAIQYADKITTVSNSYAEEIKTPYYGESMDGLLQWRSADFTGIVNGIDTSFYDPETDPALSVHYGAGNVTKGKKAAKAALQKRLGLDPDPDALLIGMVSRLTEQKGLDLVLPLLDRLSQPPFQLAVLGSGEPFYQYCLADTAAGRPGRVSTYLGYNEDLARQIYAGSDAFLMPSRFEPCGLSQLIALRYGSLPIVRATGGLKDTVMSLDKFGEKATGFAFESYDAGGLHWVLDMAWHTFSQQPKLWTRMQVNAMKQDFSWQRSAELYQGIYRELYNR